MKLLLLWLCVARELIWHIMSFCSDWLAARRAAVSCAISQKWEMQLKWQVAASSNYDSGTEMWRVTRAPAAGVIHHLAERVPWSHDRERERDREREQLMRSVIYSVSKRWPQQTWRFAKFCIKSQVSNGHFLNWTQFRFSLLTQIVSNPVIIRPFMLQ